MFNVSAAKEKQLLERMQRLGIAESDLDEQFVRGDGPGGQKINKTSICVVLTHKPTGAVVRAARERSQSTNRFLARRLLCDRIEGGNPKAEAQAAKRKKQKDRRRRRSKQAKDQ